MNKQLRDFIHSIVKEPQEDEINAILDIFEERKYAKGATFKKYNTISKELGFILEGSVRMYLIKNNGDDITGRIIEKNNFVVDFLSSRTNEKTPISIEILELSLMLVASIEEVKKLLETNLTLNILMREYLGDMAIQIGRRHIMFLTGTAKERYQFILENNPTLLKKFPLRFIASIIGITPTQLSRIRNQK